MIPTFSGVDGDAGGVELLLRLPVLVPAPRPGREGRDHQQRRQRYTPSPARRSTPQAQQVRAVGHEQAEAHAGDVEDPLRDDEAHVEEQVGGRDEGEHDHGQGHDENIQRHRRYGRR